MSVFSFITVDRFPSRTPPQERNCRTHTHTHFPTIDGLNQSGADRQFGSKINCRSNESWVVSRKCPLDSMARVTSGRSRLCRDVRVWLRGSRGRWKSAVGRRLLKGRRATPARWKTKDRERVVHYAVHSVRVWDYPYIHDIGCQRPNRWWFRPPHSPIPGDAGVPTSIPDVAPPQFYPRRPCPPF